jgi:hypothetical protein
MLKTRSVGHGCRAEYGAMTKAEWRRSKQRQWAIGIKATGQGK